jgi:hypothetical protein
VDPVVVLEFPTEQQAVRFEKYLKSGSGRAFAERHFSTGASCAQIWRPQFRGARTPTDAD